MGALWFSPLDDAAKDAIAVTSSAEDPQYLAANAILEDPQRPAGLTTTTGWVKLQLGAPTEIVAAAFVYPNLDEDLAGVVIQGDSADDFSSPWEQAIPIGPPLQRVPFYTNWVKSQLVIFDTPQTFAWWRWYVPNANSLPIRLGRFLLFTTQRDVDLFLEGDMPEGYKVGNVRSVTEMEKAVVTPVAGPQRRLDLTWIGSDIGAGSAPVQDAAEFRQLIADAGVDAIPWMLAPFFTADPWFGRIKPESLNITHMRGGAVRVTFTYEEESRGLPYP